MEDAADWELDDEQDENQPPLGPEDVLEGPIVEGEGETPTGGRRDTARAAETVPEPPPPRGTLARSVMMQDAAAVGGWREMTRAQREHFARSRFRGRRRRLAYRVLADMAATSDQQRFDTEDELYTEVLKRVTSSIEMQESQDGARRARTGGSSTVQAFGYPFTGASLLYGPRVNYAAREYWTPNPPDGYAVRADPVRNRRLRSLPRGRRHEVYGDADDYSFDLTARGQADFFNAIAKLFIPQLPHKRSLIHCDYLVSLVQFRSFAATLGQAEFNRRAAAYGPARLRLTWDLFSQLEHDPHMIGPPGPLASLQEYTPANEADMVIGDHVYFWNHQAYDLINEEIGNAWRLENTILVDRIGNRDVFLGHGSGRKSSGALRAKLAEEYNDVVDMARPIARRADRGEAAATADMAARFPNLHRVGTTWRVQGTTDFGVAVDLELRRIRPDEVIGPHDPGDPSRMYPVRRPIESA